jgi:hypothetical protein
MLGLIARGRHRRVAPRTLSTRGLLVWAAAFSGLSWFSWQWARDVVIPRGSLLLREAQNVPFASLTPYEWVVFVSACVLAPAGAVYAGIRIFGVWIMATALTKRLVDRVAAALAAGDPPSSPRIPGLD